MSASREKSWCLVGLLLLLGGCESVGYYTHLAGGQLQLLGDRQPVEEVLAELPTGEEETLRQRLLLSQRVLDYAETELLLEVGGRYRS